MGGGKTKPASAENEQAAATVARLQRRSAGKLLTDAAEPFALGGGGIPRALARSDGADIVKKNAKKKNYLFAFPGGLTFPPGGRVGKLDGLDTSTPTLDITFPEGRLRLRGTLVFPRNALLTLRGASGGRPVRVVDTFETIIVFSEWAWLGPAHDNPGDVSKPLPSSLGRAAAVSVWSTTKAVSELTFRGGRKKASEPGPSSGGVVSTDDGSSGHQTRRRRRPCTSSGSSAEGEDEIDLDSSESDSYRNSRAGASLGAPTRSNPRRGRRVDFSKMFEDSDNDDDEDDDEVKEECGDEACEEDGDDKKCRRTMELDVGDAPLKSSSLVRNRSKSSSNDSVGGSESFDSLLPLVRPNEKVKDEVDVMVIDSDSDEKSLGRRRKGCRRL